MVSKGRNRIIAGLDIGSSKVACFIAELDEFYNPQLLGYGQHLSTGLKRGMIVDMDRTEQAIREAVHAAEDMAGVELTGVIVSLGGAAPEEPADRWAGGTQSAGYHRCRHF